jgi:SAM-dependent methyltransferase
MMPGRSSRHTGRIVFATLAGRYPTPAGGRRGLREALADQFEAGLGMVSDGRVHRVLTGSDVRRVVSAWRLTDALAGRLAQSQNLEQPPVKVCILGPLSLGSIALDDGVLDHLHDCLVELFGAGAPVVQVNEDALVGVPGGAEGNAVRATARDAWQRLLRDVEGHVSLAIVGGNADGVGPEILFGARFASYLLDVVTGPDNWHLAARAPTDRGLIVGVGDARLDHEANEAVMVWGAQYAAALGGRGPERVGLAPSAGLEALDRHEARARLWVLAEAARKAGLPSERLAREIDPRAVSARAAALGRYEPGGRRVLRRPRTLPTVDLPTPVQPDALRPTASDALGAWAARVRADREQVERLQEVTNPADFYSPVASRFRVDPRRTDDPVLPVLRELARPTDTWLDIGAGGGRYALPLALEVREVIAVDPSHGMLSVLRDGMREHGIDNIRVIEGRWPLELPGTGESHLDVALMAHIGYDIEPIGPFLDALERSATRACVAVLGEGAMTTAATLFWKPVYGEPRVPLPALPEFLALLIARGRLPEVRLVDRVPPTFDTWEDLLFMARRQLWVREGSDRDRVLVGLLRDQATERAGRWSIDTSVTRIGVVVWVP